VPLDVMSPLVETRLQNYPVHPFCSQEAATVRDQLKSLTSSDTTSHGVRVVTQSAYQRAQSRPEREQYLWAYRCVVGRVHPAYSPTLKPIASSWPT